MMLMCKHRQDETSNHDLSPLYAQRSVIIYKAGDNTVVQVRLSLLETIYYIQKAWSIPNIQLVKPSSSSVDIYVAAADM